MKHDRTVIAVLLAIFVSCFLLLATGQTNAATYTVLRQGERGSAVTELQTKLQKLGYFSAKVTGNYDPITTSAVKRYQASRGLVSDGIVGQTTWLAINQQISAINNQVEQDSNNSGTTTAGGQAHPTPKMVDDNAKNLQKSKAFTSKGIEPPTGKVLEGDTKKYILGFTTVDYPEDNQSYNSVQVYGANMSNIATFSYLIDGSGNLNGETPHSTIQAAKAKGAQSLLLIHNFKAGFDPQIAHDLLSVPANRQKLIANLLTIMKRDGYSGVNIDIEGIFSEDRDRYNQFLRELRAALKPLGHQLTVSIPPKTGDEPKDGWSGGYDYVTIGQLADKILLMTYDEHWSGDTPGPIASLSWVNEVTDYAIQVIPKEKILLGIPVYGYDWSSKGTQTVQYADAAALAQKQGVKALWSGTYQVPYFNYSADGVKHEVWYENEESIRAKLKVVQKKNLGGIGIWRLGYEDTKFWQIVNEELR